MPFLSKSTAILVALSAALLAPAASADPPVGFRESVRLTPIAQALSGNPQAVVYCARTTAAMSERWQGATSVEAFTVYAENAAYFQPYTCGALERWLRGKPVTRYEVAMAAFMFGHEAVHLNDWSADERAANCGSLATLARTLRVHFAVKSPQAVREMVAAAREFTGRRSSLRFRC